MVRSINHNIHDVAYLIAVVSEWKGRDDGLVAHVFFEKNHNFALSVFAFAVEGYAIRMLTFYSS